MRAQAFLAKIDTPGRRWLQIQYAKRRRTATGDESWLRAIGGVDQRLAVRSSSGRRVVVTYVVTMMASLSPFSSMSAGGRGRRTRFGGSWGVTKKDYAGHD